MNFPPPRGRPPGRHGVKRVPIRILERHHPAWHASRYHPPAVDDTAIGRAQARKVTVTERLKQLIQIGIALTSERQLSMLLERIVAEARRFTNAEAGTLFLRDGDVLRFAVAQNDVLAQRMGEGEMRRQFSARPLPLTQPSLAGYVALTGQTICLPDAYGVPRNRPYAFNQEFDHRLQYQTGSVLVVPLRDPNRDVIGVLELINARDAIGVVVPFEPEIENLVQALAAQAAVAIRNARLEELSFKDPLTGVYNRRYFALRLEEEAKRQARFGEPLSLVLLDIDRFKGINDALGHRAGDEALKETARLIVAHSRSFSIVTRYGGDEFAVLLVNTPKSGALKYAQRIRDVVERHAFDHGPLTVSVGIAALPDDVLRGDDLVPAADRALYAAKRGRSAIEIA
jgi:diguanylate cyclase (GGDEF)-like protein